MSLIIDLTFLRKIVLAHEIPQDPEDTFFCSAHLMPDCFWNPVKQPASNDFYPPVVSCQLKLIDPFVGQVFPLMTGHQLQRMLLCTTSQLQ